MYNNLTVNNFSFNGNISHKFEGRAMIIVIAPSYPNIYWGTFQETYLYAEINKH